MLPLVLALIASAPDPSISKISSEEDDAPFALWIEPVGMVAVPIATALTPYPDHRIYVALGSNLKLGSTVWSTELSFFHWEGEGGATIPPYELLAFQGAVGPILHTSGGTWLDGFFVQPKLSFEIGSHMLLKQTLWSIEAAVDAGYQLRRGPFYGALLIGVGLGYGELPDPGTNLWSWSGVLGLTSLPTKTGLVASVNLNLVRVGMTF